MGRYLFTSDLHLTSRPRDEYRWEIFTWLATQAAVRKVDAVFLLGDITDQKDNHGAPLINRLMQQLRVLAAVAPVHIIKGNHDYVDPARPYLGWLNEPCLCFYTTSEEITVAGDALLLLPHTKRPNNDWKSYDMDSYDLVLLHQTITGAVSSNGFEMEGLSSGMFKRAHIAISGDIHVPQRVGKVVYCGAPYPVHFGDRFKPRVLYWNGKALKSIPRHTLSKSVIKVSDPQQLLDASIQPGDQVRVQLHLPRAQFCDWQERRAEIIELCARLEVDLQGLELRERSTQRVRLSGDAPRKPARDPLKLLEQYCKARNVEEDIKQAGAALLEGLE